MSTPEGRVKDRISALLKHYDRQHGLYYNMPVPGGFGKSQLDYAGAFRGRAFAIEAKAPGKELTPRQEQTIEEMQRGGVLCFFVATNDDFEILEGWLDAMSRRQTR